VGAVRLRFEDFTFDAGAMTLEQGGRETHLSRKAFDLLRVLLLNRHRVVTKAELHAALWPDTYVVDTNLNVLVAEVRKALGDNARAARLLKTVHGVGYRFCGTVVDAPGASPARPRGWLVAGERTFALQVGETFVGRDPSSDIWLDVAGVSRRHARIVTSPAGAITLEDTRSTNGTYVGRRRISGPVPLEDGDEIHFGSVELTFRAASRSKETERVRPPEGE
jgi:DNA-binding winged helix-turn-helix (wHTH) protein